MQNLLMSRVLQILVIGASVLALSGCAARREAARAKLPVISTVCVDVQGITDPGRSFAKRRTAYYLTEAGFKLVEADCDATATFATFNSGDWEILERSLFGKRSSNSWRTEGVISIRRGNEVILEDQRVDLRDYGTMQDLLEAVAADIAEAVSSHFRSPRESKR
jgi:hypothetical protein